MTKRRVPNEDGRDYPLDELPNGAVQARAKIAAGSLWRVRDQTAAYLQAMGSAATARQLRLREEELGRFRSVPPRSS